MKIQYKILTLLLLIPISGFSFSNDFGYSKQKNIKKSYTVTDDATLSIDNSYGKISISTWDDDKIELDILIKVSGNNEKWVNQKLNDLDVSIEALKSKVSAFTKIENSFSYNNGNNSFEINYVVKIPKKGNIIINNKYGDIYSTDLFGNATINCKYGKVVLGKLTGVSNIIDIAYCPNSMIDFVTNANVIAKYSQLKIVEIKSLNLISDYTDVAISDCQNINYTSKYGVLKFGNVKTIQGKGDYLTIKIVELYESLSVDTKYSTIIINLVKPSTNSININGGYTSVSIGYSVNYAFDFDLSGKYFGMNRNKDLELFNSEETNGLNIYNGFYKKKGVNKIKMTSNYGSIKLTRINN